MYKLRSLPLAAHLAIAAVVGTTFGAAAGLWSVRHGSRVAPVVQTPVSRAAVSGPPARAAVTGASSSAPAQNRASGALVPSDGHAVASPVQPVPPGAKANAVTSPVQAVSSITKADAVALPVQPGPSAKADGGAAPAAKTSVSLAPSPSAGVDGKDVLMRAKALAQRADVKALVALRESVVRRAEERGETGSAASKLQLDEFDRYLEEARRLRLKLDAEEFRHAEAAGSRPR